jgi:cytochrome c2
MPLRSLWPLAAGLLLAAGLVLVLRRKRAAMPIPEPVPVPTFPPALRTGRGAAILVGLLVLAMAGWLGAVAVNQAVWAGYQKRNAINATHGDPGRAPALMVRYGCSGCHQIPGVPGAAGGAGPPLAQEAGRLYIGGVLPNTPDNLVRWILNPQAVLPGNLMPATGIDEAGARDVAAYLYQH